jgi:peptidoglycan hydrolase CwlO-like protein
VQALRQQRHLHSALAQLSSAKHELADQMAAVREDNARLTAELLTLRQEREAAAAEGGSSSDEARAGAGGVPAPAMQQQGPGSFAPASTGDLSVQVGARMQLLAPAAQNPQGAQQHGM